MIADGRRERRLEGVQGQWHDGYEWGNGERNQGDVSKYGEDDRRCTGGLTNGTRSKDGAEQEGGERREDGDGGGRKEGEDCGAEDG